jgi:hypothetical protein
MAGGDVTNLTDDAREGGKVVAQHNVLHRMTAPDGAEPTDGDSMIFFRR